METEDQAASLRRYHCDELQGFLISRPLPAEQVPGFLHKCCSEPSSARSSYG
ncbi:hypothetical protein LQ952_04640 [Ectothiorhodospira sp. B14B]|nr:hypothetical protein [Ectothiorhodospira lacustris]